MSLSTDQIKKLQASMHIRACENCGQNGQLDIPPSIVEAECSEPIGNGKHKTTGKGVRMVTVACMTCGALRFFHAGFCLSKGRHQGGVAVGWYVFGARTEHWWRQIRPGLEPVKQVGIRIDQRQEGEPAEAGAELFDLGGLFVLEVTREAGPGAPKAERTVEVLVATTIAEICQAVESEAVPGFHVVSEHMRAAVKTITLGLSDLPGKVTRR